jgi:hypothetical protein
MKRDLSLLFTTLCFLLAACAAPSTKLQNSSGQVVDCSASGFGVIGTAAALSMHKDCVEKMQTAGYRPVSQGSVAPKPSAEAATIGISLPSGWEQRPLTEAMVSTGGSVFATNKNIDAGVLVSVASREGVTDLMAYATSRRANQENKLLNAQSTEVARSEINDNMVFRFEVSGYVKGGMKLTYLYTIVVGKDKIVVVNAWTKSIDYSQHKPQLEALSLNITGLT